MYKYLTNKGKKVGNLSQWKARMTFSYEEKKELEDGMYYICEELHFRWRLVSLGPFSLTFPLTVEARTLKARSLLGK